MTILLRKIIFLSDSLTKKLLSSLFKVMLGQNLVNCQNMANLVLMVLIETIRQRKQSLSSKA